MSKFVWGKSRKDKLTSPILNSEDVNIERMRENFPEQFGFVDRIKQQAEMAPPIQEKFLIHRSAILTYKACPYKAYLEYWYKGHGVTAAAMPQHLLIGICIHRGLQHLLEHCRVDHPNGDFTEKCIDDAVMWTHNLYKEILSKRAIELKKVWNNNAKSYDVEDLNYTIREIYNLLEALIRAYAVARLGSLLEEYEVLEVEKEEVFDSFSEIVTWLGKADGLLRRKVDNELVVLSFKTAAEFGHFTMSNILIDMQGCSEIVAVEDRLNKIFAEFRKGNYQLDIVTTSYDVLYQQYNLTNELFSYFVDKIQSGDLSPIRVFANQYEYLVKGKHRADSSEPLKFKYQTHLLHPIKSDSMAVAQLGSGLRFGASSKTSNYEWVTHQGKLPKGKKKIDIYETDSNGTSLYMSVKQWIHMLASNQVQPEAGSPFQDVIIGGEERLAKRSLSQLREWRISTQFEAEEVAGYLRVLEGYTSAIESCKELHPDNKKFICDLQEIFETKLIQFFSRDGKDAQLCFDYYGGKCPFTEHCHQGLHIDDGLESGMYIVREPHHELEKERFKEKGYLE